MNETVKTVSTIGQPIFKKYGVRYAGLFDSHARGDARPDSDIDILVSLGDNPLSLWELVAFRSELAKQFNKPVDLVSDQAVVPYFRDYIYRDLKTVYGQR